MSNYKDLIQWDKELPQSDNILCVIFYEDDYEFAWYYHDTEMWEMPDKLDTCWVKKTEVEKWKAIALSE